MNETDARNGLLIRAFETAPVSEYWGQEDRDWASRSAAQIEGEKASAEAFVSRRAALAVERLSNRQPRIATMLAAVGWNSWIGWLLVAAALGAGFLVDAVNAEQRINILAPPILAILLWNLLVYLVLIGQRAWQALRPATGPASTQGSHPGPVQRLVTRAAQGIPRAMHRAHARFDGGLATPLQAFLRQWAEVSAPLNAARALAILHFAAAAFAVGALVGLYIRGLAFEYVAGWESTFLEVDTVRQLLTVVLGPAAAITGITLPDAAQLSALRVRGGAGQNAAAWIHLYAVTVLMVVVLPRVALGLAQSLRTRRMATHFQFPLADNYFQNLRRLQRGEAARVQVIPYSFQLPTEGQDGLNRLLRQVYGKEANVSVAPAVALGGEDRFPGFAVQAVPLALVVALYSLSATPETENHAAFLAMLARTLPDGAALLALVDETAFLKRFGADSSRLTDRRATWRRILATGVDIEPVFVSLDAEDFTATRRILTGILDENPRRMVQNARFRAGAKVSA